MTAGIIEYGSDEKIKRKHYRLDCSWNISCCEYQRKANPSAWFLATTTDISGGGCRFNSTKQVKKNSHLLVKITNPIKEDGEELLLKAGVIVSQLSPNREEIYETRVQFIEISFEEQQQLIKWIFEQKRRMKWQERGLNDEEKYFGY